VTVAVAVIVAVPGAVVAGLQTTGLVSESQVPPQTSPLVLTLANALLLLV
jgi:hypothetical protein